MITFKGVHANAYKLAVRIKKWAMVPSLSEKYVSVPGRHGSYLFPGKRNDLLIDLECGYVGNNREDMHAKGLEIKAWLYSEERDVLSFDVLPGKHFVGKPEGEIDLEPFFALGRFDITFRCEPFAYGEEQQDNFVNDSITVNNTGTAETPPEFTVTFTAAASEWKVTLGSKYVRVVRDFQVGDILEVNCATGAVLVNGIRSMLFLDWQNSEFFTLAPGNNDLTVLPAGVCATEIKWTPRWL
ncbi:distal tail protein Dit [Desulfoscipio geothermicus]|uniref:Putative phage tail component, N-terminal domain-containing protein n=1 Tax=Desulfoscipio geothermicus DSM 3669 TaxID=1121426 RepID=A0A1I6EGV7_9FIRM|nr:distal tail protein Dit [Desulfoscipio geothermicus]SFR16768.1 putative phage tail component, N-terminal domain-containing protein [Desulfoscipio geothermicus DSM 3669]